MHRFTHLRTFLAIYRCGSVTRAASQLNITQPAASGHLQALEVRLGRSLFERSSRGLTPLEAAHDLARAISDSVDGLENAFAQTRKTASALAGTVHLGGPPEFLGEMLLPALAGMDAPGLRLRCRLGLAAELIEAVAQGDLDFAIATVRIERPGVGFTHLYDEDFRLVGAPRWRTHADIRGTPLLAYEEGLPIIRRYWRAAFGHDPDVQAALVVPDLRALEAAAAAGLGITVLPGYLCARRLASGELTELHRTDRPPSNAIHLAWNKATVRTPRNAYLLDRILDAARAWQTAS
jgi:DNA-binding transcriptional LysR family regulator